MIRATQAVEVGEGWALRYVTLRRSLSPSSIVAWRPCFCRFSSTPRLSTHSPLIRPPPPIITTSNGKPPASPTENDRGVHHPPERIELCRGGPADAGEPAAGEPVGAEGILGPRRRRKHLQAHRARAREAGQVGGDHGGGRTVGVYRGGNNEDRGEDKEHPGEAGEDEDRDHAAAEHRSAAAAAAASPGSRVIDRIGLGVFGGGGFVRLDQ